jgi:sugar phosphate isomerase/epimerase
MRPHLGAVYVKDFLWEKTAGGWRQRWCPLGQGLVRKSFFDELKTSPYTGPISQHHEYFPANTDQAAMLAAYKADLQALRKWLE